MEREHVIDKLNDLIRLDLGAVGAYQQAIEACDAISVRETLTEFLGDHERHVQDLSAEVKALGGEPVTERGVGGAILEGFTAIASRGDHSALVAMRGNEELTNRVYRSALDEDLPATVLEAVTRNYVDEQRHLTWIKDALARRVWEQAA